MKNSDTAKEIKRALAVSPDYWLDSRTHYISSKEAHSVLFWKGELSAGNYLEISSVRHYFLNCPKKTNQAKTKHTFHHGNENTSNDERRYID